MSSAARGVPINAHYWCNEDQDPSAPSDIPSSLPSVHLQRASIEPAFIDDVETATVRLAGLQAQLVTGHGDITGAYGALGRGLIGIDQLPVPFETALLELAYGQMLRRAGQRRAAATQLQAARDRLSTLNVSPYLERCDRELAACGLTPVKRTDFEPGRLTAQESAVARLVATGMGNRQVASELFVSIKTVQFHLTHIYSKLGISSRGELAAQFRDIDTAGMAAGETPAQARMKSPKVVADPASARPAQQLGASARPLTAQESAVARLVVAGMDNRQVANELFIGIPAVKSHLKHVFAKLGISTRSELVNLREFFG